MVFSNPEAVRRIQRNFIPVALKAAQVNNPPPGLEGRLYAEIGRSKPAPQGICVANSDGKALAWALSFDSNADIAKFLDHAEDRYRQFPDAGNPVPTQRYRLFPSYKLADVTDTHPIIRLRHEHPKGEHCLGQPLVESGTLVGRIIGRALDENGKPIAPTVRQEHYLEARVEISPRSQDVFIEAARETGARRFRLPPSFTRALVAPAYLGQLDVNPVGPNPKLTDSQYAAVLHGQRVATETGHRIRITGESDIAGEGQFWEHRITLEWEGYIDIAEDQISRIAILGDGKERLVWGHDGLRRTTEPAAKHLMAGHAIDLDCKAAYGFIAGPAEAAEIATHNSDELSGQHRHRRISTKVKRLQVAIRRHRQAGSEIRPIAELMQKFSDQIRKQDFANAEDTLDRALKFVDAAAPASEKK